MSKQVEDSELADVAAVSAGNNYEVGNMIAEAMSKVGRKGVLTIEEGKSAENSHYVWGRSAPNIHSINKQLVPSSNKRLKVCALAKELHFNKDGSAIRKLQVLAQDLIAEGVKVVAAGANPVLIARGIEKTTKALVNELKAMSKEMAEPGGLEAAIAAGNEREVAVRHGIEARLYVNAQRLARLKSIHRYYKRMLEHNRARLEFALENLEGINEEWIEGVNELLEDPDNPDLVEDMQDYSEALRTRMNDVANTVAHMPDAVDNHHL